MNTISKGMTIQNIDPVKDKDVINTNQNLVNSVKLKFRTVIVNQDAS
ncbi:MAG: hypothetical protein GKR88_21005 [Flavobacteriaceae bacterium]|nr:MAG: hypothetical protein GKR88_21005 [Flavobacteriaceae bacterium]